jgi:hypothetical protein
LITPAQVLPREIPNSVAFLYEIVSMVILNMRDAQVHRGISALRMSQIIPVIL